MNKEHKRYIGDGVYVCLEGGMLCLTTENGIETTNTIYLEPEGWRALKVWVEQFEHPEKPKRELLAELEKEKAGA